MSRGEWICISLEDELGEMDEVAYGVSPIPGKKRIALYRRIGTNRFHPIAWFRDEEEARRFVGFLGNLVKMNETLDTQERVK